VKQVLLANVNHAQICSWNQPVLSNEETTGAFDGVQTHDWQAPIDY